MNEEPIILRRLVGVDPGSNLGIVSLQEEPDGTLSCRHALTITRPGVTPARPRQLAELEQARLFALFMQTEQPDECAMEEPWDVSDGWGKGGRRLGTGFRIGAAWGFAAGAIPPGIKVAFYPVRGKEGWMGRGRKDGVMLRVEHGWERNVRGVRWAELSEHEQAAAGVLLHHMGRLPAWVTGSKGQRIAA